MRRQDGNSLAKQQPGVFLVHGPAALALCAVVPMVAAEPLFHVAENAVGEAELGQVEVAPREQFGRGLGAAVFFGQRAGDVLIIGAQMAVAGYARLRGGQRGLPACMGCGDGQQQGQVPAKAGWVHGLRRSRRMRGGSRPSAPTVVHSQPSGNNAKGSCNWPSGATELPMAANPAKQALPSKSSAAGIYLVGWFIGARMARWLRSWGVLWACGGACRTGPAQRSPRVVVRQVPLVLGLGHFHIMRQGDAVFEREDFGHHADGDFGRGLAADVDADGATQSRKAV